MAVVLANAELLVRARAHPLKKDAHGYPVVDPDAQPVVRGPYPGAVVPPDGEAEGPDAPWRLRLDPQCWPVRDQDTVADETGREWIVRTARLSEVPGCSDVDYIAVVADPTPPQVL